MIGNPPEPAITGQAAGQRFGVHLEVDSDALAGAFGHSFVVDGAGSIQDALPESEAHPGLGRAFHLHAPRNDQFEQPVLDRLRPPGLAVVHGPRPRHHQGELVCRIMHFISSFSHGFQIAYVLENIH